MLQSQVIKQLQLALFIFHTVSASRTIFEDPDEPRKPLPKGNCVTPDNKTGRCVRWTKCQSLRGIADLNLLQAYICGIDGKQLKVCCSLDPKDQLDSLPSTRTPKRLPKKTKRPRRKKTTKRRRLLRTTTKSLPPPIRITTSTPKSTTLDLQRSRKIEGDIKPPFLPDNCGTTFFTKSRVVGGQVAEKGGWPWMAIIFWMKRNVRPGELLCGGSLVTDKYVITAAHCVVNRDHIMYMALNEITVRLGAHDLRKNNESESIDVLVEAVRFHEQFDGNLRTMKNDIAVLRLRDTVRLSPYISPVCLPYDSLRNEDLTDKTATVTGFGSISEDGPMSPILMETSFLIWDQEICERIYEKKYNITDSHLCAGSADGSSDTCKGDSGGPLVAIGKEGRFYVVGIVSSGYGCARPGYPGIYTRVTTYLDWLAINLAD